VFLDAALGKLPGVLADTSPPEQFSLVVAEDYSDIWPETFRVDQDGPVGFLIR
jgi:hypothetical protein